MENKTLHDAPVVVALDIGTTKVCAIAGRRDTNGKIEILAIGKVESEGVSRGVVSNIEKTVKAIKQAIAIVERKTGKEVKVVHVGIAGQHIKSVQHRGILTRENDLTEIDATDIQKLITDMYKLVLPPGDRILHVIPQEYTVDSEQGITDPIGMSGVRLEANFHIVTGQITASNNIHRCVERVGVKVADMTLEPIASAGAILSEEEKEAGVALVDIGGGTTDITIFHEGIIRHTAVIPFGGNVITKDIKEGCMVLHEQAEKLKRRFGAAIADEVFDNRIITIPGLKGREPKEISEKNLALIIQARVEEILDYVLWEIRKSGFERNLIGGIVLTGGGSLLNHIDKLVEYHTGYGCRIGIPVEFLAHGYQQEVCSPIFATGLGLLFRGISDVERGIIDYADYIETPKPQEVEASTTETVNEVENTKNVVEEEVVEESPRTWYDKLFRKTKEFFETERDREF